MGLSGGVLGQGAQVQDQFEDEGRQHQGAAFFREGGGAGFDEQEADFAVGGDAVAVGDAGRDPYAETGGHHPHAVFHGAHDAAVAGHHQLAFAVGVYGVFGGSPGMRPSLG